MCDKQLALKQTELNKVEAALEAAQQLLSHQTFNDVDGLVTATTINAVNCFARRAEDLRLEISFFVKDLQKKIQQLENSKDEAYAAGYEAGLDAAYHSQF